MTLNITEPTVGASSGTWGTQLNDALTAIVAYVNTVESNAQPVDSDLTAIAALTTTAYGRSLLTQANAAAAQTILGLGTAATQSSSAFDAAGAAATAQATALSGAATDATAKANAAAAASQPLDSDLTAIAALTTTAFGRSFLDRADATAARTLLGLGTLATQSGTFSGTSSGTNTGDQDLSALAPKASPALTGTPTAPTASVGTNTTQVATTAFVASATSNYVAASPAPSAWQATHAYTVGQTFTQAGSTYVVATAYTSGGTFGSTDTSNAFALGGGADQTARDAAAAAQTTASAAVPSTLIDAKGDLLVGTADNTVARLAVGADATVLTADSTQAAGVKYTAVPAPGPTYNLLPQYLKKWRRAIARVRAGTANGMILCTGDSTTAGNTGTFGTSYPSILTNLLNTYYVPAAQTWMIQTGSGGATADPRVSRGANWTAPADFWQNVSSSTATPASDLTFSPSASNVYGPPSVDTFDIYTFNGTFSASVNGGTVTNWTASGGAAAVTKTTVTCTAGGSNVLTVNTGSGFVIAVNAYLSTSKVIQIANKGVSASKASDWATASPGLYTYPGYWYTALGQDLTVLDLGKNDAGASSSTGTYSTNMQTLITRGLTAGDVLLKSWNPSTGTPNSTFEPTYIPILNTLSGSNSVPFLDVFTRWQSYAVSNPLGYYLDGLHPSTFGYSDIAQAVFNTLRSV